MHLISKQEAEGHCVNPARCFKMADWVICAGCERAIMPMERTENNSKKPLDALSGAD